MTSETRGRPGGNRRLIGTGIALLLIGPSVLWTTQQTLFRLQHERPEMARAVPIAVLGFLLPLGGLGLFVLGWLLVGAGFSRSRGALVAAAGYVLIGLVWAIAFNTSLGTPPARLVHPAVLLVALFWPLQVAQVLGLFGLRLG